MTMKQDQIGMTLDVAGYERCESDTNHVVTDRAASA
jgi:hypothetical protein